MLLKIFFLACLLLIKFLIQSTTCAVPTNIQTLELDDITPLWDKFSSIIDKIKEAVNRYRCPKGWKRVGISCYYLSNITSTSIHANYTCNLLHSNLSNLIQIKNTIQLFYAAHLLIKNNLSSLIINIHPNLLQDFVGKPISQILKNDQDQWQLIKEKFYEIKIKYERLKVKIVKQLASAGFKILRRTKKIIQNEIDYNEYEDDFNDRQQLDFEYNETLIDNNDEYEYDEIDFTDENDTFDEIPNIYNICDRIDWNVRNNNSMSFILITYIELDKTICSLSDVDNDRKYNIVCEYVLDFCLGNIICGKHGQCMNIIGGFKCSCSFLYGGLLCEKVSEHGRQIIISIIIILILFALSIKCVRKYLWKIIKAVIRCCKKLCVLYTESKQNINDDKQQLVDGKKLDNNGRINTTPQISTRRPTLAQEIIEFFLPKTSNPLLNPVKRNLVRTIWVGFLTIFFSSVLFISTSFMYFMSFGYNLNDDRDEEFSINDTVRLVTQCEHISDYRRGNIIFAPFAFSLILIFSWSLKREEHCLKMCDGRPALIPPIEPFRTGNRFTTATTFGILAFEVLKIFEGLLFSTGLPLHQGVLIELLERIALVILVGLRYYPVLASLQLRNIVVRCFSCIYIICDMIYTIVREGSCMGYLPLSGHYTLLEEAKLRKELGTWFIVYGLIKNIPHFFLLSYLTAELCIRCIYDSIYIPFKKKTSIWISPIVQSDESEFAKYYVTKLFRRNTQSIPITSCQNLNTNPDNLDDHVHEADLQNKMNQSRVKKFFDSIYQSDDDFRFTTIATCTYTVAIVFLYYLACTFVFLYLSRTTGHISYLKFYIETTFDIDLGVFSLNLEIIVSVIFTVIIYGCQLFIGMQNYKRHKLQLYRGIYVDVPSIINFKPSSIASNSVHYSGFLVGYLAWGFVICFHLILLITIAIKIVWLQIRHIEIILTIVVPVLVIYFLKMLSMRSAGKFLFIQQLDDKLNLKSRKTYALFIYFSFFADCFLGIASCIIRLIKATFLNVVFMARLDWSFLGRPLEKFDLGFAAYISYLHMEVTYTNPVMLAFCYSLFDDIVKKRPKHCYDDECCIAPGELDDEIELIQLKNNNPNRDKPMSKQHLQDLPSVEIESEITTEDQKHLNRRTEQQKLNIARKISKQVGKTSKSKKRKLATSQSPGDDDDNDLSKLRKTADKDKYTTVPTEDEFNNQEAISSCSSSENLTADRSNLYLLRTKSYRNAHQSISPLILHRPNIYSTLNNDSSSNSQKTAVSNRSYSKIKLQQIVKDEKRSVETDDDEEEEEDDDDDEHDKDHLLPSRQNFQANQSTTDSTTNSPTKSLTVDEKIRKKQLRFRWHFLYTIIRNYHLFDLRKDVQGRLTRLHLQRSNLIDEQQFSTTAAVQPMEYATVVPEPLERTTRTEEHIIDRSSVSVTPASITSRPSSIHRLVSVNVPVLSEYPSSPAERYIAIRAQMLYDANTQAPNAPYNSTTSQTPITATSFTQKLRSSVIDTSNNHSLGFHISSPNITIQPPSDSSTRSRQTQTTDHLTPILFQPASASNQSTADYPLAASSAANSTTLRTQMSHDQHMQVWRQDQTGKIQKKQRYCYIYGQPPQTPLGDKVSTAAILTPQILSTSTIQQQGSSVFDDSETGRRPTISPFQFPQTSNQMRNTQLIADNQKLKTKHHQQGIPKPPPRMDRVDEDPQEISTAHKSKTTATTSVLIHEENSHSDTSDTT